MERARPSVILAQKMVAIITLMCNTEISWSRTTGGNAGDWGITDDTALAAFHKILYGLPCHQIQLHPGHRAEALEEYDTHSAGPAFDCVG